MEMGSFSNIREGDIVQYPIVMIGKFIRELYGLANHMNTTGDVLNIFYIINQAFFERAFAIFNPRNAMYISRNDGKFNNSMNHCRDTIINSNTLINLSRKYYSEEQIQKISNAATS